MKESARYAKIVAWSDEDQCYVGSSPGLVYGGCHGSDEKEVFEELCEVVEEAIALCHQDGKPLPPATSGRDFANIIQDVARLTSARLLLESVIATHVRDASMASSGRGGRNTLRNSALRANST